MKTKPVIVSAKNLRFSYGDEEVVSDVSLDIHEGEFVGLLGSNGSGKTTLAKMLLGLLMPTKGSIKLMGTPFRDFRQWDAIGYVPQRATADKNFPASVDEILSMKKRRNFGHIVDILGLRSLLPRKFSDLSGGQQQRILIALSLLTHPKLLILDEPEVGVDVQVKEEFYQALKHLNDHEKVTIILITHDVLLVSKYVHRVICITRNICCDGSPKNTGKILKRMYGESFHIHRH